MQPLCALATASFATLVALPSCLDATPGRRAGDGAAAAEPDACARPGTALAHVARETGAFAIGPCGVLAYWQERDGRALRVLSSEHTLIAAVTDDGYAGAVGFAPSGTRLWWSSLRSDLGFGDLDVAPTPARGTLVSAHTFAFPGSAEPHFLADERLAIIARGGVSDRATYVELEGEARVGPVAVASFAGGRVFYALANDTAPSALEVVGADGAARELGEVDTRWLEGSTVRTRGGFVVTGDGARVVLTRECHPYGGGTCETIVDAVIDAASGALLTQLAGWRAPLVGAGSAFAAATQEGAALFDAAGTAHVAPGHTPLGMMEDHLLTTADGALHALDADGVQTLVPAFIAATIADGGEAAAVLHDGEAGRVAIWRARTLVEAASDVRFTAIAAVWDDGVTLATGPQVAVLLGGDGAELARWDSGCVRGATRVGARLFFELCAAPNDELHRFDLGTARDVLVAEGHDFDFATDPRGDYVAFTVVPLSGTVRELQAGRIGE